MRRFSYGYIGSTSVRGESVRPGGLSQQVDRGWRCQGNHEQDNYSASNCSVCEIWNTQEFADCQKPKFSSQRDWGLSKRNGSWTPTYIQPLCGQGPMVRWKGRIGLHWKLPEQPTPREKLERRIKQVSVSIQVHTLLENEEKSRRVAL